MARFRLYCEHTLCLHETYFLTQSQGHYVAHVLRLKTGDCINVFNEAAGEFEAKLDVTKKTIAVTLEKTIKPPLEKTITTALLFTPLKHGPLEMLIQKGTELGATDFYPVITKHTAVHKINGERLRLIATEASEQCGRLDVPVIHPLESMTKTLSHWHPEHTIHVCDESLKDAQTQRLSVVEKHPYVAFLIGPEGGFHPDERKAMQTLPFIKPVSLGPLILKAETAALVCLSFRLLG